MPRPIAAPPRVPFLTKSRLVKLDVSFDGVVDMVFSVGFLLKNAFPTLLHRMNIQSGEYLT